MERRPEPPRDDIYAVAGDLGEFFSAVAHPEELLRDSRFTRGVELLSQERYSPRDLLVYARGNNRQLACMALEALARKDRTSGAAKAILAGLGGYTEHERYFALRALDAHARAAILVRLLVSLDEEWLEYPSVDFLREFVEHRLGGGESLTVEALWRRANPERRGLVGAIVDALRDVLPAGFADEFARWRASELNLEFLKTVGRVWAPPAADDAPTLLSDRLASALAEVEAVIAAPPRKSVLVSGEPGVGKTTLLQELGRRLQEQGWTIFEASSSDVLAEQIYIGQLEARVRDLVRELNGKRVVWFVPAFHEAAFAGRHRYNPRSLLDLLLPHVESGEIQLLGAVEPASLERVRQVKPAVHRAFHSVRLPPANDAETLEVARLWAAPRAVVSEVTEETLAEALELAKQYLGDAAAPGNLVRLLDETRLRLERAGERSFDASALLVTLSELTGLPVAILDDRAKVDLDGLRAFFAERVLGQPEAVNCLVERIAMMKAGLTDPSRPYGVFLFVGPTGTGKTEIARTLAAYLFGSPDRLIRLDMTEFQHPASLSRILGELDGGDESATLLGQIRQEPFSVVLLDEFEKAHPSIWDVFLQVFDAGRLTDRRGSRADFRHAVVIMTSNVGAPAARGPSLGFSAAGASFAAAGMERAVTRTFRPEFLNRIDRMIVFRPLTRETMREILRKELNAALGRRGLRTRSWAVEWDESAVEFLLEKGFSGELGARPLKRAIEQYLLAPLAMTIVEHRAPEGDQFLFVRSKDERRLEVVFIDPDAAEEDREGGAALAEDGLTLQSIALGSRASSSELPFLQRTFEDLRDEIEGEQWQGRKQGALEAMSSPDFWSAPERFAVLGTAEYMDRIEAGLRTAGSLLSRLNASANGRRRSPPELVERLAEQLYLIRTANAVLSSDEPRDAFLSVEALDGGAKGCEAGRRIGEMYRGWAKKRRMRFDVLEEESDGRYRLLAAVAGFGAFAILERETGLHVFEEPTGPEGAQTARFRVHVQVAPQPRELPIAPEAMHEEAGRALAELATGPPAIVRRYREKPSPLVRDGSGGWRSGRVDVVLGGDFDLMAPPARGAGPARSSVA